MAEQSGPGETSLPGLWIAAFSLCPHMVSSLCLCVERKREREREREKERDISGVSLSSHKDTSPIGLGPYPYELI